MNELETTNVQLLMNAMTTAGQRGATYQLPQEVMTEYARLLRRDERQRCAARLRELSLHYDRDYRECALELAAEMTRGDEK